MPATEKQTDESPLSKKDRREHEPTHSPEQVGSQPPSAEAAGDLITSTSSPSIQAHAAQLSDTRLSTGQRQAMAAQIGEIGGNQYMQSVMLQMKQNARNVVQPKLTVNEPGDPYEQKADQVADNDEPAQHWFGIDPLCKDQADVFGDQRQRLGSKYTPDRHEVPVSFDNEYRVKAASQSCQEC